MLKFERTLRIGLAAYAVLVGPLAFYFVSGFHLPSWGTSYRPLIAQVLPLVILALVYVSVYKPKFFGVLLLALAVFFYLNMSTRVFHDWTDYKGQIFFEFDWWKRYRSMAHFLKRILPLLIFAMGLIVLSFSRLRDFLTKPRIHFSLVGIYLLLWIVGGQVTGWLGRQTGNFPLRDDGTGPFFRVEFYKFDSSVTSWMIFVALLLLISGSVRGVKEPVRWGRWILLAGLAALSAILVQSGYHTRALLSYGEFFWNIPFLLTGGGFLALGIFETRSESSRKKTFTTIWILFLLCFVSTVWVGFLAYRNYQYKRMTMEARTNIRRLQSGELSFFDNNRFFVPVPPNISEIPKGICVPLSRVPANWAGFTKIKMTPSHFKQEEGEPCFRYRYQVIVCPGSKQCDEPELKKMFRNDSSSLGFVLMRAEGDLDGDGTTSLFEKLCTIDAYSKKASCGSGFYTERDLE